MLSQRPRRGMTRHPRWLSCASTSSPSSRIMSKQYYLPHITYSCSGESELMRIGRKDGCSLCWQWRCRQISFLSLMELNINLFNWMEKYHLASACPSMAPKIMKERFDEMSPDVWVGDYSLVRLVEWLEMYVFIYFESEWNPHNGVCERIRKYYYYNHNQDELSTESVEQIRYN